MKLMSADDGFMFKTLITNFRMRTTVNCVDIGDGTDDLPEYRKCTEFLDTFISDDDQDVHFLNDYITFGNNGDGTVNIKLLKVLAEACTIYEARYHHAS
jgi:hypothetical protein